MSTKFGFAPYVGTEPFVFISYKSEDYLEAAKYALFLHDNGINVYYDAAIKSGTVWQKELLDTLALDNCKGVVLIVSSRSLESQPVEDEVGKAHYLHKPVLGVYIENTVAYEEPMKTYLMKTQAIMAWNMDPDHAFHELLEGANNILYGNRSPKQRMNEIELLLDNANVYLINGTRANKESDIEQAILYYRKAVEGYPSDYRGWLGLAKCECLKPVDLEETMIKRLRSAADFYSYIVSSGSDSAASVEYTSARSVLWKHLLSIYNEQLNECEDLSTAKNLQNRLNNASLELTYVDEEIRVAYDLIAVHIKEKVKVLLQAEELEKAASEREIIATAERSANENALRLIKQKRTRAILASVIIACSLLFILFASFLVFYTQTNGVWYAIEDGKATASGYYLPTNGVEEIKIRSSFFGYEVTSIADNSFREFVELKSVYLPESIESIGKFAFADCPNLQDVKLPSNLSTIGEGSFAYCISLEQITIPERVENIDGYSFYGSGLSCIDVPENVSRLGEAAFAECIYLSSISLPDRLTSIANYTFMNCISLDIVSIPTNVEIIGDGAFSGCSGLTEVKLPFGLKKIGNSAFSDCIFLSSVNIPSEVEDIGEFAFSGCSRLSNVVVNCNTFISDYMFSECNRLESIIFTSEISEIGMASFYGCTQLKSIDIPEGVQTIGDSAFMGCSNLQQITIPASVSNIEDGAFSNCTALKTVQNDSIITELNMLTFSGCKSLESILIPNAVENIHQFAFAECVSLSKIVIPEGTKVIDASAFLCCTGLESVYISASVEHIDSSAFVGCEDVHVYAPHDPLYYGFEIGIEASEAVTWIIE